MLTQILLCLGILAIWYVLYWAVRNDDTGGIGEQTGLIRMRRPEDPPTGEPAGTDAEADRGRASRRRASGDRPQRQGQRR
jgi:hypothetical protein